MFTAIVDDAGVITSVLRVVADVDAPPVIFVSRSYREGKADADGVALVHAVPFEVRTLPDVEGDAKSL
jgi:hypothetical protein